RDDLVTGVQTCALPICIQSRDARPPGARRPPPAGPQQGGFALIDLLLPALAAGLATTLGALPFLLVHTVPRKSYDALLGFGAGRSEERRVGREGGARGG